MIKIRFLAIALVLFPAVAAHAQSTNTEKKLLKQTIVRNESQRLGYGGTVTVVGAPEGSIVIEGWARNEVSLSAEIELHGQTEEDLKQLSQVNGFVFDEDLNHIRILSAGTHDRAYIRRVAKNFPKKLIGLPWKISYRLRVPAATDLAIDAGKGPITVSGVEGAIRISATESETKLSLSGGTVIINVAIGKVDLTIPVRSWRGAGAEVRLASGTLSVELPAGFNGDINADVLRGGKIENSLEGLTSREKPGITPRSIRARAGAGGAFFQFTVGDGTLSLKHQTP